MIIGVDIDNILNNSTEATIKLYNARTGKNIQMSDIKTYNFIDCLPKDDADGIVALFKEKELWDSLEPTSYSQQGMKKLLHRGHQIVIATATHPINFEWKCKWMEKYFPFIPTDNIIRIMDKSLLDVDVLIDDSLDQLTASICDRICLNYAWNYDVNKDFVYDIHRCKDWKDIIKAVDEIEKEMKKWMKE